jgi:hypothetical protein
MIIDQQQANQSSGGGLNVFSSTTLSISLSDSSVGFKAPEPVFEQIETTIRAENLSENLVSLSVPYSVGVAREETSMTNIEEKIDSAVSFSGFSAVNVLEEERSKLDSESQTDQTASTVNQTAANNELAGGVTLASLGSVPQGFNAYSASMPDSSFYAPREIYRNQKTVDNPAGRRLFGATDRLHQEMVDQQYNQGAQ